MNTLNRKSGSGPRPASGSIPFSFFILLTSALTLLAHSSQGADLRDWRASDGKVVSARLLSARDNKVIVQTKTGRDLTLERDKLSVADQKYIEEYTEAGKLPNGKISNPANEIRIDKKLFKKREEKFTLKGISLEFDVLETPHFLVMTTGGIKPQGTAETAEMLWHETAFNHPTFDRKWRGRRMAIFLLKEKEDYNELGKWRIQQFVETYSRGEENAQQIAEITRSIALSWPKASSGNIGLSRPTANMYKLFPSARVIHVQDEASYRDPLQSFPVHTIAGDLLNVQMVGTSGYARQGWFAINTGHSFFREMDLSGKIQTRLVGADGYESDEVVIAGGFNDGRKWSKTVKSLLRKKKIEPNIKELYQFNTLSLTPEQCVLMYAFAQYLQSSTDRRAAFAELAHRTGTAMQVPKPIELAKIYGFKTVEEMQVDWIAFMKGPAFK